MSVRFAPSPTGSFHVGNLRTAWISHELARALGQPWVVRFEDIDLPRVVADAMERQLEDLRVLGLEPDRILVQSQRFERHESLFRLAVERGRVYPCSCSRKEIQQHLREMASAPHSGEAPIYDGRCREPAARPAPAHATLAWRFRSADDSTGRQDFVVGRTERDGSGFAPAYHWACAIDDLDGGHALLVRASDLEHVIRQQRQVFEWLAESEGRLAPYPAVFHAALVTANDGSRLEKRTRGVTLTELVGRGVSGGDLVERFRASFDPALSRAFAPGKIWGELPEQIPLGKLGIE